MGEQGRLEPTRRSFLKAAGVSALAAAGAFGLAGCASSSTTSGTAVQNAGGVGRFNENLYTDVFPVKTRSIPVLELETDLTRTGNVAFELRDIAEREIKRTEEADVLVAGCGLTGSVAALSASDDGKTKVLCLEKMDVGRGMFEGMGVIGGKKMEEGGNVVDKAQMMDVMRFAAQYRVPVEPIKLWGDRSGEAADWLQEKFDEGEGKIQSYFKKGTPATHGYGAPQTEIAFKSEQWSAQTTSNAGGAGIKIVADLANTFKKRSNAELRYNAAVVKLERKSNGRVTGAICKDADGYFRVNTSKGVVLATGGFDANPTMLKAWCRTEDVTNYASWCPNTGTTGDGQLMGLAIGGQMDPLPAAVMNFDYGNPQGFYSSSTGLRPFLGGIMVNELGKRFCAEDLPFQARSNAISAQKGYGECTWRLSSTAQMAALDDATRDKAFKALEPIIDKGWAFRASSLDDLAAKIGCDASTLKQEVARFNGYCDVQKDEDFYRDLSKATKIDGQEFYALIHQSTILATVSGLVVDYYCHVLDYDNNVIEGLYAAGGASGGFFSGNYPRHIFGPSVGRCVTFGYVSGQHAAKGE
jgi:succinate dehydrogenase/fumarate reductase flavoprotein subunit